ncbi:MAG: response regulator [Desulfobulbaceae bacterium]|nr:response regulator [Desulfobulbaceae bacterium]HIJ77882.1 response regulator [Deltaproteobacteria bacterium]
MSGPVFPSPHPANSFAEGQYLVTVSDDDQRYKKLLAAVTDYTYTVKIENGKPRETLHSVNSFAVTGYTPDEYMADPFIWFEMIHVDDRPLVVENLARLMDGVAIPAFEHRIIHKNGSVRWVRNTSVPSFDQAGNLVEYDALVSDITDQKIADEKVRKATRAYKTLSLCNQAMVRLKTEQNLIEKICQILVEVGGYSLAWVGYAQPNKRKTVRIAAKAGKDTDYLKGLRVSWADDQCGRGPTGLAIRSGRIAINNNSESLPSYEPWRKAAIQYGYRSSIAVPLGAEDGVFGALNIYANIDNAFADDEVELLSELAQDLAYGIMALRTKARHKSAVEALRASEKRLQAIFDTVQTGIVIVDQESRRIVDANMAASRLVGRSVAEMINKHCHLFICPAEKNNCPVLDHGQEVDNSERYLLTSAGKNLPIVKSVVEFVLNGRKCLLESFLDISQRVEAEAEKARLEAQLRQAQKLEAIGTLAGGIAHDFNNMLNAIIGYGGLLRRSFTQDSKQYEFALAIEKAGKGAADLIQQILSFSRPTEEVRKPLCLQYMIKEVLKLLRSTLPTTIELQVDLDMHCRPVLSDATQISQVVMNLGTNAYHAMRESGGVLSVKLDELHVDSTLMAQVPELAVGDYARLTVSDNGCGMDPATMERIFEPYFTTKKIGEGTGLGLAVVHGIMRSHGGAVFVESRTGQGSIFTLFFPVVDGEVVVDPENEETKVLPDLGKRVLIVDDVGLNVSLAENILKSIGCSVAGFLDSTQALAAFAAAPAKFDLIITDQTMPGMTGLELAQKALAIRPDIPVVMVTGYSDMVDEHKATAAGVSRLLFKPVELEAMIEVITELLTPQATLDLPE